MSKRTINVGTIGHVDHGKTTLTASLVRIFEETEGFALSEEEIEYVVIDSVPDLPCMAMIDKRKRKSKRINRKEKLRGF